MGEYETKLTDHILHEVRENGLMDIKLTTLGDGFSDTEQASRVIYDVLTDKRSRLRRRLDNAVKTVYDVLTRKRTLSSIYWDMKGF